MSRVLTVADNAAPFEIIPANGTAGITVTPVAGSGGSGTAEFAQVDVAAPVLAANEFSNVTGIDTTGLFSTPLVVGDFIWINGLYLSSPTTVFAAAVECQSTDTIAVAIVAFSTGNVSPGNLTCRIGRVPAGP